MRQSHPTKAPNISDSVIRAMSALVSPPHGHHPVSDSERQFHHLRLAESMTDGKANLFQSVNMLRAWNRSYDSSTAPALKQLLNGTGRGVRGNVTVIEVYKYKDLDESHDFPM
ncbi:hypothetical protein Agabi119p4_5227 [Agaricus bisporus var. burnettii]|uniref:Uncharacterized protein n=1 Tax=Agaricus bisporus var. burnettii TaxID=192524 RepID=A0A8H7KHP9_AGABI|nr:hypothetical protein Agabi119p4_5227 [Agaricus bisporus var. burnettii]